MRTVPFAAGACAGSLCVACAFAQAPTETIVVTATRQSEPVTSLTRNAVVIAREALDTLGDVSLAEALQRLAGIEIRGNGGPGQPAGILLRGAAPAQTLVLVDGLRVASVASGLAAIEHLPLDAIERIEIVKGPLSTVYGADAIGGVVQVFTRRAARDGVGDVRVSGGSERLGTAQAGLSVAGESASVSLRAGTRTQDAASATNAAAGPFVYNPDRDPYRNTHAALAASWQPLAAHTFALDALAVRANTHFDGGPDSDERNRQRLASLGARWQAQWTPEWESTLQLGETRDKLAIEGAFPSRFDSRQQQWLWQHALRFEPVQARVGVERIVQRLASSEAFDTTRRRVDALFAGVSAQSGDLRADLGARRDQSDRNGSANTAHAGIGLKFGDAWDTFANVGGAFRLPTFNDLYYPGFSNPELKPERSRAAELGARWREGDASASITAFTRRVRELIVFTGVRPENVARASVRGVEANASLRVAGFALRAAFTLQDAEDDDTGKRLRNRARALGSVGVHRAFGAWSADVDVAAQGARFDSPDESPGSRLPGYAIIGASLAYQLDARQSLRVTGRNLADKRYELSRGYDVPRRMLELAYSARF